MRYEHDQKKLAENVAKHQVWFALANEFDWENATIIIDSRRQYDETRFRATGLIAQRVFVLVFCFRVPKIRIISLRKANPREVKNYAKDH